MWERREVVDRSWGFEVGGRRCEGLADDQAVSLIQDIPGPFLKSVTVRRTNENQWMCSERRQPATLSTARTIRLSQPHSAQPLSALPGCVCRMIRVQTRFCFENPVKSETPNVQPQTSNSKPLFSNLRSQRQRYLQSAPLARICVHGSFAAQGLGAVGNVV